jgi:hypothetical protein
LGRRKKVLLLIALLVLGLFFAYSAWVYIEGLMYL